MQKNSIQKEKLFVGQLTRFVASGILATLIDLAVLNLLLFLLRGTQDVSGTHIYFVCKTISFVTASIYSFFASKYFTFKDRKLVTLGQIFLFGAVSTVSFMLNVLVPVGLFRVLGGVALLSPFARANFASVVGTAFSFVCNFSGYKFLVFKK